MMRYDKNDPELDILKRFSGGFAEKRVLEVGCGNGRISRKLAPLVGQLDAIDPDEDKIAKAIELGAETTVTYHARDLDSFISTTPYDIVILSWSL